jgi:predicted metal-binding membrane protein/AraC-like DNA-binding protein
LAWSKHAHDCVQLIVALKGALRVRERARTPWRRGRAVVVKADVHHEIDASGSFVVMAFIDASSALGVAVTAHLRAPVEIVSNTEAARWRQALGDSKALDSTRIKKWVTSTLIRNSAPAGIDPRVERVIHMLRDARATSLMQLSRIAGLSSSRFAHVFAESMGVPVRPYLRWLRLQRAARELVTGRSVTHAAHVAGFADAAHLTRTFHVPVARPRAEGAQRDGRLVAPARRVQQGLSEVVAFLGVSALIFASSAAVTIAWCASMSAMGGMPMPGGWTMSMAWMRMSGQTWPGAVASFLGMWVVMMGAMMLPSLVPMLWRYREAVASAGETRLGRLTALVGVGYFLVWTVFGLAAFLLGVALAAAEMQQPALARAVPIAAGMVILIAGAFQFTARKARHLACCREALGRRHPLPADARTAWRHGLRLGLHCSYCCRQGESSESLP